MRRISTGVQGRPVLGKYFSIDNVLSTLETNTDIRLEPSGSGKVIADADLRISSGNSLEIVSSGSSNSVNLVAPNGLGSNLTLTLPANNGTAGDVLTVDGSGNLSFTDLTIEVADQTAATESYFPLLSTANSGSISDVTVSSSKLSYQPSTGTLESTLLSDGTLSITLGSITNAANGTFSGTVQAGTVTAGTITETSSMVLKQDIEPLSDSVRKIFALNPVEFTRKSTGEREAGLIAEEVEQIIPELVNTEGTHKSVSYSRLTAYLIDAVKELAQKNG